MTLARRTALVLTTIAMPVALAGAVSGTAGARSPAQQPRSIRMVIGNGTPQSCTSAAVVEAVAKGGTISFDCGRRPVTITMAMTTKVVNTSHRIVIDGGGLVTLSGDGKRRILYMNTCDQRQTWTTSHCEDQKWPRLVIKNMAFIDGNAAGPQRDDGSYGGGAMFIRGGRLSVTGTTFRHNRCHPTGPDLGGAAIRALSEYHGLPVIISHDLFRGGRCSNGGALSSIGVSWDIDHTTMVNNSAVGRGANPARSGTPGGGSGGAIYTDGDTYDVHLDHSVISNNHANEGGGAVFFVSNDRSGSLSITHSTLHDNPSDGFSTAGYPGIFFLGAGQPHVRHSTIN